MPSLKTSSTIEQGADFQREYTVLQADGSPIPNFTSGTARAVLNDRSGHPLATFAATLTSPTTILISLTAAQTLALPPATLPTAAFDVKYISVGGATYRIGQDVTTISGEQTP
jgi:hypothetical protein